MHYLFVNEYMSLLQRAEADIYKQSGSLACIPVQELYQAGSATKRFTFLRLLGICILYVLKRFTDLHHLYGQSLLIPCDIDSTMVLFYHTMTPYVNL